MAEQGPNPLTVDLPDFDAPPAVPKALLPDAPTYGEAEMAPMSAPAPETSFSEGLSHFGRHYSNEYLAALQGHSPILRKADGTMLVEEADQAAQDIFNELNVVDDKNVVFYHPDTGKLTIFKRNPDLKEGFPLRFGRLLGLGAFTGPAVTTPARRAVGGARALTSDFSAVGVDPSLATASQSRAAAMAQNTLRETPFVGGMVSGPEQTALRQTGAAAENIASQYGPGVGRQEAGEALQRGARGFIDSTPPPGTAPALPDAEIVRLPTRLSSFAQKSDALYSRLGVFFSGGEKITVYNAIRALAKPLKNYQNAELGAEFTDPKLARWAGILERSGGSLTWNDLKSFRSDVGRLLNRPAIVSDIDQAQLRHVYGQLSEDLRLAASAKGPAALRAFERANSYYAAGRGRIDAALTALLAPGRAGEGAFGLLETAASAGGKAANSKMLTALKRSMPQEEWDIVSSAVIRQMGIPPAGAQNLLNETQFSATRFVTQYAKMSEAARSVIFGGAGREALQKALDSLAKVAAAQRNVERLANRSGTGRVVFSAGLLGLATLDTLSAVAVVGGSAIGAKLIMNPTFVRWLTGLSAAKAKDVPSHIAKLRLSIGGDPELLNAVDVFAKELLNRTGTMFQSDDGDIPSGPNPLTVELGE